MEQLTRVLRWIRGGAPDTDPVSEWHRASNRTLQRNGDDCGVLVVAHAARSCGQDAAGNRLDVSLDVGHPDFDPSHLRELFTAQLLFPRLDVLGRAGFAFNASRWRSPLPEPPLSDALASLLQPVRDDYIEEQGRIGRAVAALQALSQTYTCALHARRLAPLQAVLGSLANCRELAGAAAGSTDDALVQNFAPLALHLLTDLQHQSRAVLASPTPRHAGARWLDHDADVVDALFPAAAANLVQVMDDACGNLRVLSARMRDFEEAAAALQGHVDELRATKRRRTGNGSV
ncbi:hypothetical protein GGR56DRAFT_153742 [Xylariaceae sp. FL0804]|nr:hypothetical protein GGR56DRAFT_153742 [Xylariaceae sp. FL0804]